MAELCDLKDCGREAVIGTMEKWGPEYRVAMCEHHAMERLARLPVALEALEEAKEHMGEAWQEYRRLWLRWFEERVEKRYAKKRERELRQRLDVEVRAGRILGESE